ncbi:MAG: hypothetical protein ISS33_06510 [Candidatus Omnitrophica bacterium]|nr:hypothetical protein [Candidatus Omnitrophota bacterium]
MKKIGFFYVTAAVVLGFSVCAFAQEEPEEVPAGMEVVYIGNTKKIVPAGTKVHRKKGFMVLESTPEYVARKMKDIQEQFTEIKKEQQEIKDDLKVAQTELSEKAADYKKLQKDIRRNAKKIEIMEEEVWGK